MKIQASGFQNTARRDYTQKHTLTQTPYHIGMGLPWHCLRGVLVKELVDV